MPPRRPSPSLLVALVALVIAIGGVAVAAPGGGGSIQGCYDARGQLRVVDTGAACAAGETPLNWNQQGRDGPAGPAGERGPAGAPGTTAALGGPDTADQAVVKTAAKPIAKPKKKIKLKIAPTGEPTNAFAAKRQGFGFAQTGSFDPHPTVARLDVPAGRYFVLAKGLAYGEEPLLQIGGGCVLDAGGPYDAMSLRPGETMVLTLLASFAKPSGIELRCARRSARLLGLSGVTISAINVAKISAKKTAPPF